ncbi:MAG: Fe-S cluster assembly protein SufB [Chlamydiota bacterium]
MQKEFSSSDYKYGFSTPIESETFPKGLNEEVIRKISKKKNEPSFILQFRLKAFQAWQKMKEPHFCEAVYPPINYQDISYYSEPKSKPKLRKLEDADPEILKTLKKLGVPFEDQKRLLNVSVDVVFDSVSIGTSFQEKLKAAGVVLCPISEAVHKYPEQIEKYLGSVVSYADNFFAALNASIFSDGSFVYIPKGVKCPIELSTYFRINEKSIGQFERTLIVAEEDSYVSYLEGCTAPAYDVNQLHGGVVELIAHKGAEIKYSTVQNWYSGDPNTGKGGIYNFVTKRGLCHERAKISWTQVEVGAAITWKYPGCILQGDDSVGEFYSVALTNGHMQADTGTRMIHRGKRTKSTIISKGISADSSSNAYRGLVRICPSATGSRNYSQCDSLLVGKKASAHTFPTIEGENAFCKVEHEASTSRISEDELLYLESRGISKEEAISMIVNGFCKEVMRELPLEFAVESQKLLALKLEGSM